VHALSDSGSHIREKERRPGRTLKRLATTEISMLADLHTPLQPGRKVTVCVCFRSHELMMMTFDNGHPPRIATKMKRGSERAAADRGSSAPDSRLPMPETSETRRLVRYIRGKLMCVALLVLVFCVCVNWTEILVWLEDVKAWESDMRRGPHHVHTRPTVDEVGLLSGTPVSFRVVARADIHSRRADSCCDVAPSQWWLITIVAPATKQFGRPRRNPFARLMGDNVDDDQAWLLFL